MRYTADVTVVYSTVCVSCSWALGVAVRRWRVSFVLCLGRVRRGAVRWCRAFVFDRGVCRRSSSL